MNKDQIGEAVILGELSYETIEVLFGAVIVCSDSLDEVVESGKDIPGMDKKMGNVLHQRLKALQDVLKLAAFNAQVQEAMADPRKLTEFLTGATSIHSMENMVEDALKDVDPEEN